MPDYNINLNFSSKGGASGDTSTGLRESMSQAAEAKQMLQNTRMPSGQNVSDVLAHNLSNLVNEIRALRQEIVALAGTMRGGHGGGGEGGGGGSGGGGSGLGQVGTSASSFLGGIGSVVGTAVSMGGHALAKIKQIGDAYFSAIEQQSETMGRVGVLRTGGNTFWTAPERARAEAAFRETTGQSAPIGERGSSFLSGVGHRFGIASSEMGKFAGLVGSTDQTESLLRQMAGSLKMSTGGMESMDSFIRNFADTLQESISNGLDTSALASDLKSNFYRLSASGKSTQLMNRELQSQMNTAGAAARGNPQSAEELIAYSEARKMAAKNLADQGNTAPTSAELMFETQQVAGNQPLEVMRRTYAQEAQGADVTQFHARRLAMGEFETVGQSEIKYRYATNRITPEEYQQQLADQHLAEGGGVEQPTETTGIRTRQRRENLTLSPGAAAAFDISERIAEHFATAIGSIPTESIDALVSGINSLDTAATKAVQHMAENVAELNKLLGESPTARTRRQVQEEETAHPGTRSLMDRFVPQLTPPNQ